MSDRTCKGIRQYEGLVKRVWDSRGIPHRPTDRLLKTVYKTGSLRELVRTRYKEVFQGDFNAVNLRAVAFLKNRSTWRIYDCYHEGSKPNPNDRGIDPDQSYFHHRDQFYPGVMICQSTLEEYSSKILQSKIAKEKDLGVFDLRLEGDPFCVHNFSLLFPSIYSGFKKEGLDKEKLKALRKFLEDSIDLHLLTISENMSRASEAISNLSNALLPALRVKSQDLQISDWYGPRIAIKEKNEGCCE